MTFREFERQTNIELAYEFIAHARAARDNTPRFYIASIMDDVAYYRAKAMKVSRAVG